MLLAALTVINVRRINIKYLCNSHKPILVYVSQRYVLEMPLPVYGLMHSLKMPEGRG